MASRVRTIMGADFTLDVFICQKDPHPGAIDNVKVPGGTEYLMAKAVQSQTLRTIRIILKSWWQDADYTALLDELVEGKTLFVELLRICSRWGVSVSLSWQVSEVFRNEYLVVGTQPGARGDDERVIVICLSRKKPFKRVIFDVPLAEYYQVKKSYDDGEYDSLYNWDTFSIDQAISILDKNSYSYIFGYGFEGKSDTWNLGLSIK